MRPNSSIRFYAFTAAVFLIVVGVGITFRSSFPQPGEVIEGFKSFRPLHDNHDQAQHQPPQAPEESPLIHAPAPVTTAHAQVKASPADKLSTSSTLSTAPWSPTQYDEVPLPDLDKWPGPGPDGLYGDLTDLISEEFHRYSNEDQKKRHLNITSKMTSHKKFMKIDWLGDHEGYNPSLIPHPSKENTWIVIAQRDKHNDDNTHHSQELLCEATFVDDMIRCTRSPLMLPIASTTSNYCDEAMGWFNTNMGPHDARLYHGRDRPYVMYNQQSAYSCVGQWLQDARRLVDYDGNITDRTENFFQPINLQKVGGKYGMVEKNWYLFWDNKGEVYIHHNLSPRRLFGKLNPDGSVGRDLSAASQTHDTACMARLMPKLRNTTWEYIHQASNALEITLCKRADADCTPTDDNTFIFHIFQTKTFYAHGQYEPYFILFKRTAPFELYAISKTPFWYFGRGTAFGKWRLEPKKPKDQSQMIFTTAMGWKQRGQTYGGFLDDELMISFGVEDKHSGVIDVTVGDLIADVAYC
ncbi:hypothetical protein AMS68_000359 [Peltaster fructicola]|uniref:Uncharacterized protein n=1 Tax=Peltaster fructicola TaxID=286661 RepID=A0A6H0XJF1_9PEZI|nr:hypothetical protein AMS68_000359 [Peltaster fructicola]